MERGLVFNIQRFSVRDGPGIRTTVFLKGCPLCCAWCHNPESLSPRPELLMLESRCVACGACREACPFGTALAPASPVVPEASPAAAPSLSGPATPWMITDHPDCTRCGACVEACPTGARDMAGRELDVTEVLAEVLADRLYFEDSGGGMTVSGGEPLAQPRFLRALLAGARSHGLHTAVDTSGFGCTGTLLELAPLTNLFLFDLKLLDDARHRQFTGVPNGPILANLRALDALRTEVWIRVPLIPGINDDEANLTGVAQLAAELGSVRKISILPYHRTAAGKFRRLGRAFPLADVPSPTPEQVSRAAALLGSTGLPVHTGS